MERTLVLVKPDAMQRGLTGEIISRLERRGLKIVGMKLLQMNESQAKKHYADHEGKPFYNGLIAYITSAPIIAAVLEGTRAVEVVRNTMGATSPVNANMGTIRGDLALETGRNLVHGSDSLENAEKEISLFFSPKEILSHQRDIDKWIIES
ncbi:MAG: nucleoside-diphosphate kinase [Dehalococcoidia bacterium]|nr:nucleoside-diphosphate kinase [Dehalococcoidia bacterium]